MFLGNDKTVQKGVSYLRTDRVYSEMPTTIKKALSFVVYAYHIATVSPVNSTITNLASLSWEYPCRYGIITAFNTLNLIVSNDVIVGQLSQNQLVNQMSHSFGDLVVQVKS